MTRVLATITSTDDGSLRLSGTWTVQTLAGLEARLAKLPRPRSVDVVCDASQITAMDTGGAVLLRRLIRKLEGTGSKIDLQGLPVHYTPLMDLVAAHGTRVSLGPPAPPHGVLARLGRETWEKCERNLRGLRFLGESAVALVRSVLAPTSIRWREVLGSVEGDAIRALPIVGLLVFLMGIVIAYQGAEQLRSVGANIFVVDLVGIALLREIAPMVTAILIAGRSGSAFTAQIGTMKVTEELDAVRVLGLSPMELLVLPKMLALIIALPLLTVYADIVGVFGGMLIAATQLGVNFQEFLLRFEEAIALKHFLIGIAKAPFFAIIIVLVSCYQGFQIRGGVDDVGRRTTISVVQSIFLVIVFDSAVSIALNWWKL